jgi:hypothetical protein
MASSKTYSFIFIPIFTDLNQFFSVTLQILNLRNSAGNLSMVFSTTYSFIFATIFTDLNQFFSATLRVLNLRIPKLRERENFLVA